MFRIQDIDSFVQSFYCIAFIEYMLARKILLDYTNLFSPHDYKKNDKIIYNYFKNKYVEPQVQIKKNRRNKKFSSRRNKI